jgi:hypothetical protein
VNDLERDLREVLHEDARHVATPASAPEGLRRSARRRQVVFVGLVGLGGAAVVAAIVSAAALILPLGPEGVPADQPTRTDSLNGISITYPESWFLIDPDLAGLNSSSEKSQGLPRLVLALSPQPPSDLLACPGMVEGEPPTFLVTVQEQPLALAGDAAAPWPATLEPMDLGPGGAGGCYPGWAFSNATWTAEGRTFEAVVGLDPGVREADREALFAAFDSMTFAPTTAGPNSVVLATGTAGGEDWELIATRQSDGLGSPSTPRPPAQARAVTTTR